MSTHRIQGTDVGINTSHARRLCGISRIEVKSSEVYASPPRNQCFKGRSSSSRRMSDAEIVAAKVCCYEPFPHTHTALLQLYA